MLHLPTSIVSSIFNPLVPHSPQTVSVWFTLNSFFDSNSPTDVFVMLHLLFETNYQPPFIPSPHSTEATHANPVPFPPSFIPSPQKQLMPSQYHSHHLHSLSTEATHAKPVPFPPPFIPSPHKQLMPTQYHSHHPSFPLHRSISCQASTIPTTRLISSTIP